MITILFVLCVVTLWAVGLEFSRHTNTKIKITTRADVLLNYYRIADLERPIWGQTFHNHDPAPGRSCACDVCTKWHPIYAREDLVRTYGYGVSDPWLDRDGE